MFGKDKKEEFHEKILYETQPNIFVYSKGILISMFVLGFLFFLYSAGIRYIGNMNVYLIESTKTPLTTYFALAVFVLIVIVVLYIILKLLIWTSIKYTITESRVIVEKGILLNKNNSMPFNTIQDVSRSQSLLGKIFSVGSITLYSAYDGKDLELKDISSPKKVENIIFENMRGTHLRRPNLNNGSYVDGYEFNPIRPNSDDHVHYRRMEDLDDLELVDAKQRKKELREIRRRARNSRNNYNNSNYDSRYDAEPNYGSSYDDFYGSNDNYRDNRYSDNRYEDSRYADNRSRDDFDYRNNRYEGRRDYPDSHHHQYSGAIKKSYERNPDKYFANNYEEFHQSNIDAQNDYIERSYDQGSSVPRDNYEDSFEEDKKSKGLSRFNPFSSNKKEEAYEENISDEEFDSTINQAMHDMDSNIRFEPSNKQFNQSHGDYNRRYPNENRRYDQSYNRDNAYRPNHDMERSRPVMDDYDSYDSRDHYRSQNYGSRDDSRNQNYGSRDDYYAPRKQYNDRYDGNSHAYSSSYRSDSRYDSRNDYNQPNDYNSNYNQSRNQSRRQSRRNDDRYNQNPSHSRRDDDRYNQNPSHSRRDDDRYNQNHYHENNDYGEEYRAGEDKGKKEKTPDDLFEKHSRKFRR